MESYLYDNYLYSFISRDINKKLGITFDEFIRRPRYEIEAMFRVIDKIDAKKAAAAEEAMSNLNNAKNDVMGKMPTMD